jgi:hypothetical protein
MELSRMTNHGPTWVKPVGRRSLFWLGAEKSAPPVDSGVAFFKAASIEIATHGEIVRVASHAWIQTIVGA